MAMGAFLSFEFGISGKCNTTKVKQPESCPLHARGVVSFVLRTSREGRMTVTIGLSWGPFRKSFQRLRRSKCQGAPVLDTFGRVAAGFVLGRALITVAIALFANFA